MVLRRESWGKEKKTYGFDGIVDDAAGGYDVSCLSYAVDAIEGLFF
jgi:hypothetical protein